MKSNLKDTEFPKRNLGRWYSGIKRDLPWRENKNPYSVWISEIILQQTRVDQGLPYYNRFLERFPTVSDLARASEDEVLKLWEGLGYYSRARNLHTTAKYVSNELKGEFPDNYDGLLALKGIGPYTASAIGSICFNLPVAAVDGNVYRVLSRYYGIQESIDESTIRKLITELANGIVDVSDAGNHNQAMMELGATVCTPKSPKCGECPLKNSCIGFAENLQLILPIRTKKTKVRERFFYYLIPIAKGHTLIRRRGEGDIWQGLYEFEYVESEVRLQDAELLKALKIADKQVVISVSEEFEHILSHQKLRAKFVTVKSENWSSELLMKVKLNNLANFAFPRLIRRYLEENFVIHKEV
ncbi:A/G-specific adenine glycosylase [Flavobacteriales bacterium]|nr:A/G-specific adenine glycosylase [Flavobacteriales bacterium]